MEATAQTTMPPAALSMDRGDIEENLALDTPSNSFDRIDALKDPPSPNRPSNRFGRPRNLRRRSFDSVPMLSPGDFSFHNQSNDGSTIEEKLSMASPNNITPNNTNHSGGRSKQNPRRLRRGSFDGFVNSVPSLSPANHSYDNLLDRRTIERKLGMSSPNNTNHLGSRSKHNLRRLRRRSFDSIAHSVPSLSPGNAGDDTHKNNMKVFDERLHMTFPNNKGHFGRSRHHPNRLRRRSFGSIAHLVPSLSPFKNGDDNQTNSESKIAEKDTLRLAISRHSGKQRINEGCPRRKSLGPIAYSIPSLSPEKDDTKKINDDGNKNLDLSVLDVSQNQRRQRSNKGQLNKTSSTQSLPSQCNSGQSGDSSYYTEMTVQSDIHLQSNQDQICGSSASSSSLYYSDGGHHKISGDADFYDEDDDDDSSNANFNFQGRNNGSVHTLESAFSLNDLGSIGTISSLSVGGDENDEGSTGENNETEQNARVQILFSSSHSSRLQQRQMRRSSHRSMGRRARPRRRRSNDSFLNNSTESFFNASSGSFVKSPDADDLGELTEAEESTVDGGLPSATNTPEKAKDDNDSARIKASHSGSREVKATPSGENQGLEDQLTLAEVGTGSYDEEYIEEILLNDMDDYDDPRYDNSISEESFVEEVIEIEDEVTLGDDDLEDESECTADCQSIDKREVPQNHLEKNLD